MSQSEPHIYPIKVSGQNRHRDLMDQTFTFKELCHELLLGVALTREQLGLSPKSGYSALDDLPPGDTPPQDTGIPPPDPPLNTCGVCGASGVAVRFCGGLIVRERSVTPWLCAECLKKETSGDKSEMFWITLFIAADGDFIHVTPKNMDRRMIRRVEETRAVDGPDGEPQVEVRVKLFTLHTLAITKERVDAVHIGSWPSKVWDDFLRGVICDLETRGDAPWKTKSH